jgi:hypothetical protein
LVEKSNNEKQPIFSRTNVCSMTIIGQTEKKSKKESWYFKAGGSYFTQTASTEFPVVGGQLPNRDVYVGTLSNNKLASRKV